MTGSIFNRPGEENSEPEKPKRLAARRVFGLAVATFLFAFLFGYLSATNLLFAPIGIASDWLSLAFLVASGVLYALDK